MHGLYRWHLPDPIYFDASLKVTLQQIGAWDGGLFERSDDISTVAYWYQHGIAGNFPTLPPGAARKAPLPLGRSRTMTTALVVSRRDDVSLPHDRRDHGPAASIPVQAA